MFNSDGQTRIFNVTIDAKEAKYFAKHETIPSPEKSARLAVAVLAVLYMASSSQQEVIAGAKRYHKVLWG